MNNIILAHCAPDAALPEPWQLDWGQGCTCPLPSVPRLLVARAPAGTPSPAGCRTYSAPEITDDIRAAARSDLELQRIGADKLMAAVAESLLNDQDALDAAVAAWMGRAHAYALLAPMTVATLEDACRHHTEASLEWDSRASTIVIRTAPVGFAVGIGIGSYLQHITHAETYAAAERAGLEAIYAERAQVMQRVRSILAGWSPDTSYLSAPLATAEFALPVEIRRGPMTAAEWPRGDGLPRSSWDLPVVAVVENHVVVQQWPERITWDDDASRAAQRQRETEGRRRREAEIAQALAEFRANPALRDRVLDDRLARGEITLVRGDVAQTLGPVRMREDGACALALVRITTGSRPVKCWMALGQLVAR